MKITTLIATEKTDAKLAKEYRKKGRKAKEAGLSREPPCDPNSMIAGWWYEGYDGYGEPAFALSASAPTSD